MTTIFLLALLLFILMVLLGGKKGLISYLTLFLNFIILIISIVFILFGMPIYLIAFTFCLVIALLVTFLF